MKYNVIYYHFICYSRILAPATVMVYDMANPTARYLVNYLGPAILLGSRCVNTVFNHYSSLPPYVLSIRVIMS